MKNLFTILSLFFSLFVSAQTSFTVTENTSEIRRPGAGAHDWQGQNVIDIPTQGSPVTALDYYMRRSMTHYFPGIGTDSSFSDTALRADFKQAIDNKQRLRLGVMSVCNNCNVSFNKLVSYNGGQSAIPHFLHVLMQAESPTDWLNSNGSQTAWVPNWNSPQYIRWVGKFSTWLSNYIDTASYAGISYKLVLRVLDIRLYGIYGEWHHGGIVNSNTSEYPVGTFPTTASLDSIFAKHARPFMKFPYMKKVVPMGFLDAIYLGNTNTPVAVGQFMLDWPDSLGVLNDHIFDTTTYSFEDPPYFENNTRMGESYRQKIMYRYKSAPWGGEPPGGTTDPANFAGGPANVVTRKYSWFGNGNMPYTSNSTAGNNFRAASAASGWRLVPTSGQMTTTLTASSSFNITMDWRNKGVAPSYDPWQVVYQLRNSSDAVLQSWVSSFTPTLFQPTASSTTYNENFSLGAITPASTYKLTVTILDLTGYLFPMPVNITNTRLSDGAYVLRTGITVNAPVSNPPTYNSRSNSIQVRIGRAF